MFVLLHCHGLKVFGHSENGVHLLALFKIQVAVNLYVMRITSLDV